jgi:hypothetical protein
MLPAITQEPRSATARTGASVTLGVVATGTAPLAYQWYRDGEAVAGATNATLALPTLTRTDAGRYQAIVTNPHGLIASKVATVALSDVTGAAISNFSLRASIERGQRELNADVTFAGTGPVRTLLRAAGPALTAFGVVGTVGDPRLTLAQDGAVLGENNGWSSDVAASLTESAAASVGAFAYAANSGDAALLRNLVPGSYTLRVAPVASAGGVSLFELFDATPAGTTPAAKVNTIAARALAGVGGRALVGGFTVAADRPVRVLLRAIGPGLKQLGLASGATDARLSVFRAGSNVALASNDDWARQANNKDLTRLFAAAGAFALGENSKDAALDVTLEPGSYTFTADTGAGSEGLVLVEIRVIDL